MNWFKNIFNKTKKEETQEESKDELSLDSFSMDELFVKFFIEKGGKFLYSDQLHELQANFEGICAENNWTNFQIHPKSQSEIESRLDLKIKSNDSSEVFLCCADYLIAEDGSILLSSNQIGENKIKDLPDNFIIIASASQIVKNKREALYGINLCSSELKPTNISTIKHFGKQTKSDDILSNYGVNNSKNLYLLLIEDL